MQSKCQGLINCPSKALRYQPSIGFVCDRCSSQLGKPKELTVAELQQQRAPPREEPIEEDESAVPSRAATLLSYATMTRYADIALRPVVKPGETLKHAQRYGYRSLRYSAWLELFMMASVFHVGVVLLFGCIPLPHSLRLFRPRFKRKP